MNNKIKLIEEQTSPLFRIMWVYDSKDTVKRKFYNNICSFHVGGGNILSVAHNLRLESGLILSFDESIYKTEVLPKLDTVQADLFNRCYIFDSVKNKRFLSTSKEDDESKIKDTLKKINFDTRWVTLAQKNICKPYLIIQFDDDSFFNIKSSNKYFNAGNYFFEPDLDKHTFLIELEIVEAYYNEDIALYKIVNTHQSIIESLPSIEIDYSILDDNQKNLYCLQSAPSNNLGKLLNKATIEGYLDQYSTFKDSIGGNYIFNGKRYLIKGYFRFGSSGAPYVFFESKKKKFMVNAVQSEAAPIQLSINNSQDGNFQFINAIASPLNNIKKQLLRHIKGK